jgi:hypothetical protein
MPSGRGRPFVTLRPRANGPARRYGPSDPTEYRTPEALLDAVAPGWTLRPDPGVYRDARDGRSVGTRAHARRVDAARGRVARIRVGQGVCPACLSPLVVGYDDAGATTECSACAWTLRAMLAQHAVTTSGPSVGWRHAWARLCRISDMVVVRGALLWLPLLTWWLCVTGWRAFVWPALQPWLHAAL